MLSGSSPLVFVAWFLGTLGVKPPKWLCYPVKLFVPRVVHGQAVTGVFICCLRLLHIYAAKGMRAYALAAAERMKLLRRLDAKEHRGKVIHTTFCNNSRVWDGQGLCTTECIWCPEKSISLSFTAKEALGIDRTCLGASGTMLKLGGVRMSFFCLEPTVHKGI